MGFLGGFNFAHQQFAEPTFTNIMEARTCRQTTKTNKNIAIQWVWTECNFAYSIILITRQSDHLPGLEYFWLFNLVSDVLKYSYKWSVESNFLPGWCFKTSMCPKRLPLVDLCIIFKVPKECLPVAYLQKSLQNYNFLGNN